MMEFSRSTRVMLLVILLGLLFSLLVFGGIDRPPAPELGDYPGTDDIVQAPERFQAEQVAVGGRVVSTDPVVIRSAYATDTGIDEIELEITGVESRVERSDHVQVFGVLTDSRTVRASNIVVVPRWGIFYTWTISFVAGLWVLFRIIRHWRIDIKTGALVPRAEPRGFAQWRDE